MTKNWLILNSLHCRVVSKNDTFESSSQISLLKSTLNVKDFIKKLPNIASSQIEKNSFFLFFFFGGGGGFFSIMFSSPVFSCYFDKTGCEWNVNWGKKSSKVSITGRFFKSFSLENIWWRELYFFERFPLPAISFELIQSAEYAEIIKWGGLI